MFKGTARIAALLALMTATSATAQGLFSSPRQPMFDQAQPLVAGAQPLVAQAQPIISTKASAPTDRRQASLFIGQQGTSLLAPYPARTRSKPRTRGVARFVVPFGSQVSQLRSLIATVESGSLGYDGLVYGATVKPPRAPSQMTLAEIDRWTRQTPGQNHAIGRYQFIPKTLRRLVKIQGLSPDTRFSPQVQDLLADQLLREAGLNALLAGDLSRRKFMHNIAKIWAGLPTSSGHSYYKGVAGNKAGMSWSRFDREMARIFPNAA